jgi:excisionase family DNA binding protein
VSNVIPFKRRDADNAPPLAGRAGPAAPAVYTVPEIAEMLALSLGTVYAMLRDGQIPARRARGKWVVSRRRFDAWLDELPATGDVSRALGGIPGSEEAP